MDFSIKNEENSLPHPKGKGKPEILVVSKCGPTLTNKVSSKDPSSRRVQVANQENSKISGYFKGCMRFHLATREDLKRHFPRDIRQICL
jgi:hypothetical protein